MPKLRTSGLKIDEIIGDHENLHTEELHNLYYSPNIIRMIKPRGLRWAGHIRRIRKNRNAYRG
jgi:hypothetical protein